MLKNFLTTIFSLIIIFCLINPAMAHWADMSAMELNISGQENSAILTIPTKFLEKADTDKDGKLSAAEAGKAAFYIKGILSQNVYLKGDGQPGDIDVIKVEQSGINIGGTANHSTLKLQWKWPKTVHSFRLHYGLFPPEAVNAKCLVSANINNQAQAFVFDRQNQEKQLLIPPKTESIRQFVLMGVEHIATGYDHILFLIALILAGGSFRYLVKIVTAFTLSHSITLSLAVLGLVALPSRLVESLIAASIIYVAAENLWRKKDEAHWLLVFLFGLVHGLGFASILREMAIPREQLALTLVCFNIGIELGQIVIVFSAGFLLNRLYRSKWSQRIKPAGSFAIMLMATFWFVQRAFLGM
jgi:hydrogenase/urease accessory protein HupE